MISRRASSKCLHRRRRSHRPATLDATAWEIERTCRGQLNVWSEFVELFNVMRTNSRGGRPENAVTFLGQIYALTSSADACNWLKYTNFVKIDEYFTLLAAGTIDKLRANIRISEKYQFFEIRLSHVTIRV